MLNVKPKAARTFPIHVKAIWHQTMKRKGRICAEVTGMILMDNTVISIMEHPRDLKFIDAASGQPVAYGRAYIGNGRRVPHLGSAIFNSPSELEMLKIPISSCVGRLRVPLVVQAFMADMAPATVAAKPESMFTPIKVQAVWQQVGRGGPDHKHYHIIGLLLPDNRITWMKGKLRDLGTVTVQESGAHVLLSVLSGNKPSLIQDITIHSMSTAVQALTSPSRVACPLRLRPPSAVKKFMGLFARADEPAAKKFELATDLPYLSISYEGPLGTRLPKTLYRIRALRNISDDIRKGAIGGYVEAEHNLSQIGTCWIHDDARVYDTAVIEEQANVWKRAVVKDMAIVRGAASVADDAIVEGTCLLEGSAYIYDHARLSGKVHAQGSASIWDSAVLSGQVYLDEDAEVHGDAKVEGLVYITKGSKVHGYARVKGTGQKGIRIESNSEVCGHARVDGRVIISGASTVAGMARVNGAENTGIIITTESEINGKSQLRGHIKINCATVGDSVSLDGPRITVAMVAGGDPVELTGSCVISGPAHITCSISGNALIRANAEILKSTDWLSFTGFGSTQGTVTAYRVKGGDMHVTRGCFTGTLDQFEARVNSEYGPLSVDVDGEGQPDDYKRYWYGYIGVINLIRFHVSGLAEPALG